MEQHLLNVNSEVRISGSMDENKDLRPNKYVDIQEFLASQTYIRQSQNKMGRGQGLVTP